MPVPYKDFVKIQEEFEAIFIKGEVAKYARGTSASTEAMVEWEKVRGDLEKIKEDLRRQGKNPDEWCIVVFLHQGVAALPPDLNPPPRTIRDTTFIQGLRVSRQLLARPTRIKANKICQS